MNWLKLIITLVPIVEEVVKAIGDAQAAGKHPDSIHATTVDHIAELPGKIRA